MVLLLVVFSAIVTNMTLTPAMLLTFKFLSTFELYPTIETCRACWCGNVNDKSKSPESVEDDKMKTLDKAENAPDENANEADDKVDNGPEVKKYAALEVGAEDHEIKKEYQSTPPKSNFAAKFAQRFPRSFWFFHVPYETTKHPLIALLVVAGITIPFFIQFLNMVR
jgi:hypothetical protein